MCSFDCAVRMRQIQRSRRPATSLWRTVVVLLFTVLGSVLLTACLAQSVVVVGEAPIPPPSEVPTVAILVKDDAGEPIVGALADTEYGQEATDRSGVFRVRWEGEPTSASVQAQGFFPGAVEVDSFQDEPVELALRPVVLRGTVVDSQGFGLPIASVSLGEANVMTDDQGSFEISRASPGTITVERPGWVATEFAWDGGELVKEITLEPYLIRALHVGHTVFVSDGSGRRSSPSQRTRWSTPW